MLAADSVGTGGWTLALLIGDDDASFTFVEAVTTGPGAERTVPRQGQRWFRPADADRDAVRVWFDARRHGRPITAVLAASVPNSQVKGSVQAARVTVRVKKAPFPAPFAARLLTFEDPEYSRELSSVPSRKEQIIPTGAGAVTVAFAADRPAYNTAGPIHFLYYVQAGDSVPAGVSFNADRRDANGATFRLVTNLDISANQLPSPAGGVNPLDLPALARTGGQRWIVGDALVLTLNVPSASGTVAIPLILPIVRQPTTPVPEAAYALLRRTRSSAGTVDECVRFAWSPDATRIDLQDPADLKRQVVRRRAVFAWTDMVPLAPGTTFSWAVQKTASNGSTHFPLIDAVPT